MVNNVNVASTEWFEEMEDKNGIFPSCEQLLRDNWFLADSLPANNINAGLHENEQINEVLQSASLVTVV